MPIREFQVPDSGKIPYVYIDKYVAETALDSSSPSYTLLIPRTTLRSQRPPQPGLVSQDVLRKYRMNKPVKRKQKSNGELTEKNKKYGRGKWGKDVMKKICREKKSRKNEEKGKEENNQGCYTQPAHTYAPNTKSL